MLPGPSRCFPFWQEVLACYVVNTSSEDDSGKKKCVPVLEDYYECMHHKKEVGWDPYTHEHGRRELWANTPTFAGRASDGAASSIPKSRIEPRTREHANGRANTKSGSAEQGGRHQKGTGSGLIDGAGGGDCTVRLVTVGNPSDRRKNSQALNPSSCYLVLIAS